MPEHRHSGLIWKNNNPLSFDQNGEKGGYILEHTWSSTQGNNSFSVGYAGGSQPHNNMPPYLAVTAWKRIE